MTASIVLLLKNAERYLAETLDMIFLQETSTEFEVLAIDSGSVDGTLSVLRQYPVRAIQIEPEAFNHGDTRNLGVIESNPQSRYVVFLSQDATPFDRRWLENLLSPFSGDPRVAGVFSRHKPRPGASPSLVRQMTFNWQTGGSERLVKEKPASSEEYEANRFYYIYFSNTSSAIRREVWQAIPFRRVSFAEDADWADRVLRAGHRIVYEPSSIVLHSHDYGFLEHLRQNADHTKGMIELFDPPIYHKKAFWLRLLANLPREVWRDWRFIASWPDLGVWPWRRKMKWIVASPGWHLASILGGWIGANMDRLPSQLELAFSRQERIRRQS